MTSSDKTAGLLAWSIAGIMADTLTYVLLKHRRPGSKIVPVAK
jgi:hypothetical protein